MVLHLATFSSMENDKCWSRTFFSKRLAEESGEAVYQINVFGPESPNIHLDTSSFLLS